MNYSFPMIIFLATSVQAAAAQDCLRIICSHGDDGSITPARLVANLPAGFDVKSIGGNTRVASRGDAGVLDCRPLNQLPKEVSIDQASLYGSVLIAGKLEAHGILRFEPNEGGELDFRPGKATFKGAGKFSRTKFEGIKRDAAHPPVKVASPRSLANADCWQADAVVELSDFSVVIEDTSAAGTFAHRARVTAVGAFTKCTWGGD